LRCTMVMTVIYLIITMLVTIYKYDFVNLTCAVLALYMLTNLHSTKPKFFRCLVAGIVLSLVYDVLWFWEKYRAFNEDDDEDGGMERTLRRFSLTMATISFFFKIIMCFIYWKASIDLVKAKDEERRKLLDEADDLMDAAKF